MAWCIEISIKIISDQKSENDHVCNEKKSIERPRFSWNIISLLG